MISTSFALLCIAAVNAQPPKRPVATHIIRFLDEAGIERYGQVSDGNQAELIKGDAFGSRELTGMHSTVAELLAPVPRPAVLYGIGLNYWGHINSTGLTAPKTPSVFGKGLFSYNHPFKPVRVPSMSTQPDYEGELAVVIGTDCRDVSEEDALDCVLGYTVCNDVSARCFQRELNVTVKGKEECLGNGGQFTFSKSLDTHAPLGPQVVHKSVLGDGSGLRLTTRVNGELRQNVSTTDLIFGVKKIVSFVSAGITLPRGSVICTGTPDGVGDTQKPAPIYLQDGDVVDITIDGIGTLSNPVYRPGPQGGHAAGAAKKLAAFGVRSDLSNPGILPKYVARAGAQ